MLKHVSEPLTVKNVSFKNRFAVSAMVTNFCNYNGNATKQWIAYHEERAKGGFGLIITEDYAVTPEGKGFVFLANLFDDSRIASHRELTERVHAHGTKIFAQIYHCGYQTAPSITHAMPEAPSPLNCWVMPYSRPEELTRERIHEIVEAFGDTALRAKKAGFDGVEIHGGHGYLIAEFMSYIVNKRTDEYGGNLYNRTRFPREIIANIRQKCGEGFIICFKISGDEERLDGRTIQDTKAIAMILEEAGIDMIDVSSGMYAAVGSITSPPACGSAKNADLAGEVKKVVNIPVINVGNIYDPWLAEEIVASGKADMVAMARGSLADPHLPEKALRGDYDDVRQCIGCQFGCDYFLSAQMNIRCSVNPLLGREHEFANYPQAEKKKVAIVGAGPAGMQAAITACARGHEVHLFEKSDHLGGQLRLASIPPLKGRIGNLTAWMEKQINESTITLHLNTEADAKMLAEDNFDEYIIATGAVPIIPPISGVDAYNVVTAGDVLTNKCECGQNVVVLGGGQIGAETALHLAMNGKKVTIVEMLNEIAIKEPSPLRVHLLKHLMHNGVQMLTSTKAERIHLGTVTVSGAVEEVLTADTVVLAVGMRSDNTVGKALEDMGKKVIYIGDSQKVAQILEATSAGFEAAMHIGMAE